MSPEQIRGEKATQQSDIYSLGVTLYELIAGRPPLNGGTTYELMMAHLNLTPTPLAELRPDIPARLSDIIARALEKEPAKRFATAAEFLEALRSQSMPDLAGATTTLTPTRALQEVTTGKGQPTRHRTSSSTGRPAGAAPGFIYWADRKGSRDAADQAVHRSRPPLPGSVQAD